MVAALACRYTVVPSKEDTTLEPSEVNTVVAAATCKGPLEVKLAVGTSGVVASGLEAFGTLVGAADLEVAFGVGTALEEPSVEAGIVREASDVDGSQR